MPIEIIGRIGSIIETLTGSLDLHVFADAGGRASNQRIWGGLACVGSRELTWLDQKLDELKLELSNKVEETGELKGKHVPQLRAQELGRSLRKEDRRSVFWATWCCEMNNPDLIDLRDLFSKFLSCQKADSLQFENWFRRIDSNFKRLKDANKHKLLSILQLME